MSIYGINFSKDREKDLREVFLAVEQCCQQLGLPFYIIGALARDIWFAKGGIVTGGTKDIDFAVLVHRESQFEELKAMLVEGHKFKGTDWNAFVFVAPNGTQIDILPFGNLEIQDGVTVTGAGITKIKVNGFKEVYLESVCEAKVLEDKSYSVASLPAIFMLKLISHDNRPEQRAKDPIDCMTILLNYFNLQADLIFDNHNDLFNIGLSNEMIGARVIGREISKPLSKNQDLRKRVEGIVEKHIALGEKSSFVLKMATTIYVSIEDCIGYLSEVLAGIKEAK
jgi:predicted nucleotidyltransferase